MKIAGCAGPAGATANRASKYCRATNNGRIRERGGELLRDVSRRLQDERDRKLFEQTDVSRESIARPNAPSSYERDER